MGSDRKVLIFSTALVRRSTKQISLKHRKNCGLWVEHKQGRGGQTDRRAYINSESLYNKRWTYLKLFREHAEHKKLKGWS